MNDENFANWVLGGIASLLAGAATVISMLWKINETNNGNRIKELQTAHAECEARYNLAAKQILELSVRVAALEAENSRDNS